VRPIGVIEKAVAVHIRVAESYDPLNKSMNAPAVLSVVVWQGAAGWCDESHRGLLNLLFADLLGEGPSKSVDGGTDW
jgi:hypothetical protein